MANAMNPSANIRKVANTTEPNSADAMISVAQVCSTPELLERIFSHLPALDLVMVTGVDKTFRNVVQTSPGLQRKFFMLPPKETKPEHWQVVSQESRRPGLRQRTTQLYRVEPLGVVDETELQDRLNADTENLHH